MFVIGNFASIIGKLNYTTVDVLVYNGLLILAYALIVYQYYMRGRQHGFTQDIKVSMWTLTGAILGFALLTAILLILKQVADAGGRDLDEFSTPCGALSVDYHYQLW